VYFSMKDSICLVHPFFVPESEGFKVIYSVL